MPPAGWQEITAILLAMTAFPLSLTLTRLLMKLNLSHNIIGIDVHKLDKPKIPEMCGASIPVTILLLSTAYATTHPEQALALATFSIVLGSSALVGALDDKYKLKGVYKPLLGLVCGLPIPILGLLYPGQVYNPTLRIPLYGGFHLPVIYPLTVPLAVSITSNTVNMLDPLNGAMAGSVTILSCGLLIGLLLTGGSPFTVFLYASMLFSSMGFFYFNRYPSRAFAGNVGQLAVGSALGAMAILGRTEIASIVAMFPHIQNSFFFLSRIKRFVEHRQLAARPTRLLEDGRLACSPDPKAPLTLVRILLVGNPAPESQVVNRIFTLFIFSSALAIITLVLTV